MTRLKGKNEFHINGYSEDSDHGGAPIVHLFRLSENPWHPESISFSPAQARAIAAAMVRAADEIDGGAAEFRETFV